MSGPRARIALVLALAVAAGLASAACDPGTKRPTFLPRPEASSTELEMPVPAATQALAAALAADSIPLVRIAPRDGFVESPWLDATTMRPASRRALGPSVVRLRGWVDPSRYGYSRLTVEVVYRTRVDPSVTPRETEAEVPWASPPRARVRTLLAKLGGTSVEEPELIASQLRTPRRPDSAAASAAPPPIPSPVSVDSGALLRGRRDSVTSAAAAAAPTQGQHAAPPPIVVPRADSTRRDSVRADGRRDSVRRDIRTPVTPRPDTTRRPVAPAPAIRRDVAALDAAPRDTTRRDTARRDAVRRDTTRRDTARAQPRLPSASPAPSASPGAPPSRRWSVQVAAARTRAEADPIAAGLVAGGLPARVVTSGGWFRVWVGEYGTMASADSARQSIRRRRGGAPFVVRQ